MAIVGAATLVYVNADARHRQLDAVERTVRTIAEAAAEHGGRLPNQPPLSRFLDDLAMENGLSDRPVMLIYNRAGKEMQRFPSHPPQELEQLLSRYPDILNERGTNSQILVPEGERKPLLAMSAPIHRGDGEVMGYAVYATVQENVIEGVFERRTPRFLFILVSLLIGWVVVYALTRRLLGPIREAGDAAKQIVAGQYDIELNVDDRTKEFAELKASFKEMAARLSKLESLRMQLLAGVTHELKTPVASISGLVQAVKDGVVEGEEADAFLAYSLKECGRLQSMVEDLLDFNSFAAGAVAVDARPVDVGGAVKEAVQKWRMSLDQADVSVDVRVDGDAVDGTAVTDPVRLEQIVVNLLNNAAAALRSGGCLFVRVYSAGEGFRVEVEDTGRGIPEEEREQIFLPFFRGEDKKTTVRGLGLGLPYSRLIARSLGGDLVLTRTGPEGTVFTLFLASNLTTEGKL